MSWLRYTWSPALGSVGAIALGLVMLSPLFSEGASLESLNSIWVPLLGLLLTIGGPIGFVVFVTQWRCPQCKTTFPQTTGKGRGGTVKRFKLKCRNCGHTWTREQDRSSDYTY